MLILQAPTASTSSWPGYIPTGKSPAWHFWGSGTSFWSNIWMFFGKFISWSVERSIQSGTSFTIHSALAVHFTLSLPPIKSTVNRFFIQGKRILFSPSLSQRPNKDPYNNVVRNRRIAFVLVFIVFKSNSSEQKSCLKLAWNQPLNRL